MPALIASVGDRNDTSRAVDGDRALVGTLHPVQDLHQGRLAGAVLADDRVDLAAGDPQVDVAVGDDAGESFGDADQLDRERLVRRIDSHHTLRTSACLGKKPLLGRIADRDSEGKDPEPQGSVAPGPALSWVACRRCYFLVGTVILPLMMSALMASSLALMSST